MKRTKTSSILTLIFRYYRSKNSFIVFTNNNLIRVVMNFDTNNMYKKNKHIII